MGGADGLFFEAAAVFVDASEEERAGAGAGADRFGEEVKFCLLARATKLCENVYRSTHGMTETLSIRIDANTNKKLDALARRCKRSKSFLAAEAITAYVDAEAWQLGEIQAGLTDLDEGKTVSHERVAKWLRSWGKRSEQKPPR